MSGIRLHDRTLKVNSARLELDAALWKTIGRYELTYLECVQILTDELQGVVRYGIRAERHADDPNKRGDES